MERTSDQHARLIGHANQKQKIRYTLRLKEENIALRQELHRVQQRVAHADDEAHRGRSESLFDAFLLQCGDQGVGRAFARHPGATPSNVPRCASTPGSRTPRPSPAQPSARKYGGVRDQDVDDLRQRCELQERALERIQANFQHVLTLVERAQADDGQGVASLDALLEHLRKQPTTCVPATSEEPPRTPMQRTLGGGGGSPFNNSVADENAGLDDAESEGGEA